MKTTVYLICDRQGVIRFASFDSGVRDAKFADCSWVSYVKIERVVDTAYERALALCLMDGLQRLVLGFEQKPIGKEKA